MKRYKMCAVLLVLSLLVFGPSAVQANIVFTLGNNPQPDEQNILFNQSTGSGTNTLTGTTNQTNTRVTFTSTTNILTAPSQGQAEVDSATPINNLKISLTNGGFFKDFILNPECLPGSGGCGTANLTVVDNSNHNATFSYALGNGQNFLTITAINGESIQSVTINNTTGFDDLVQPRISGIGASQVPVPPTVLLLGSSLVGLVGLRRKFKR